MTISKSRYPRKYPYQWDVALVEHFANRGGDGETLPGLVGKKLFELLLLFDERFVRVDRSRCKLVAAHFECLGGAIERVNLVA